ncbi:hypothetical protein ACFL6C_06150 [Myxococcota bacterium]
MEHTTSCRPPPIAVALVIILFAASSNAVGTRQPAGLMGEDAATDWIAARPKSPRRAKRARSKDLEKVEANAPTEEELTSVTDEAVADFEAAEEEVKEDEEEVVDFDEEETESDRQAERIISAAGGSPHGGGGSSGGTGLKLFVDLLVDYRVGQKARDAFVFRPNHFYVLLQAQIKDDLALTLHISDVPVFYELTWNVTPRFALKAGKLLVPFGANEFHHLFGGRVDELSHFLPETWGDFGVALSHVAYDGDNVGFEYSLYAVNGFEAPSGANEPSITMGDASDNNLFKGLGTRVKLEILGKVVITGSLYIDAWDEKNRHMVVFYASGLELRPGLFDVPVLRKLRLRGEWGRGEIQIPRQNRYRGLIKYAKLRGGMYGEARYPVLDFLDARIRFGAINPDHRITDAADIYLLEPAVLLRFGKVTVTLAYQMTQQVDEPYSAKNPPDVLYSKFFVRF